MKLIWHIIKKDIARDRWALGFWALLFVAQVALGFVLLHEDDADKDWVLKLQFASAALIFLQMTMGYVLVTRLVQADAPIGTSVFWLTRPISAARLLIAKGLGALLLFGLLPVLLLLPWWLYCAFGWRELLWTVVETAGWQLLMIAPAFLVASLTDDLGRVLLWTLLLVIGLLSWIVLLQSSLFLSTVGPGRATSGIMFTRLWLASGVLVVVAAMLAGHQFLTRQFARSVLLTVLGLGLIVLVGEAWPWNWAGAIGQWHRPAVPTTLDGLDRMTFTVEPAGRESAASLNRRKKDGMGREVDIRPRLRVRGLPDDRTIAVENAVQTWSWPGGLKLSRTSYFPAYAYNSPALAAVRKMFALPVPPEDPETTEWLKARREKANADRVARGLQPFKSSSPPAHTEDGVLLNSYLPLPKSFLAKMQVEPPAYMADLQCLLYQPQIVIDLPLKANVQGSSQSRTFRLQSLGDEKVTIVLTGPAVARAGLWQSALFGPQFRGWLFRENLVSVNHVTGEISQLRPANPGWHEAQIAGVLIRWHFLSLQPPQVIRQDKWVNSDEQWSEHTTLVFLEDKEIARFAREVKTDKFELEPEAADERQ